MRVGERDADFAQRAFEGDQLRFVQDRTDGLDTARINVSTLLDLVPDPVVGVDVLADGGVGDACVIVDGTTYRMLYMGADGASGTGTLRIGYASSPDGINWTKYSGNPVLNIGSAGAWDSLNVYGPSVIKDGTVFKIWYNGEGTAAAQTLRIGYATNP